MNSNFRMLPSLATSHLLEQVMQPGPVVRVHDRIQHRIHRWPNDSDGRRTAMQVKVKLSVSTKDATKLDEKKRGPESGVDDGDPETQLRDVSLVRRAVHSFYVGAQCAEYLDVYHGRNKDGKAVKSSWVSEEGFRVGVEALVDQQAAVQLRGGVTDSELISGQ